MANKLQEYDSLRIVATILIVVDHSYYWSITMGHGAYSRDLFVPPSLGWVCFDIVKVIGCIIVPSFFFLSGALWRYASKQKTTSFKKMLSSKIRRLLVPYFLVGVFYMLPIKYLINYQDVHLSFLQLPAYLFFERSISAHLWFIYVLFCCFVVMFWVIRFANDKCILFLGGIILCVSYIYPDQEVFLMFKFIYYMPYFMFGYVFERYRVKFNRIISTYPGLFFLLLCFLVIIGSKLRIPFSLPVLGIVSTYIFAYWIKEFILRFKVFREISRYSMDIYLYHEPLNQVVLLLFYLVLGTYMPWYFYSLMLFFRIFGLLFISILIAKIVDRISHITYIRRAAYFSTVILLLISVGYICFIDN